MSYTLIDYFKAFHSLKERQNLSAGSQSVYFSILGEFNAAHYPERLSLSYRELKALAGLKSVSTTHECVNVLKNKKLLDFETQADGQTWYRLLTEHLPNTNRTPTEHQPNNSRTLTEHSSRLVTHSIQDSSQDVKTLDVKTLSSLSSSRARDSLEDIDTLVDEWQEKRFGKLDFELISRLDVWLKKYGLPEMLAAMTEAKEANGNSNGVSFKFFASVLERRNKPKKGVKESGRTAELRYDEPDADTVYPWDKSGYASDSGAKQGTS